MFAYDGTSSASVPTGTALERQRPSGGHQKIVRWSMEVKRIERMDGKGETREHDSVGEGERRTSPSPSPSPSEKPEA